MTIFGWDASHFDGSLTTATLARARGEGITFFTHKIGEGTSYDDPNDTTALACARDAGIEFVGGYFVPRSTSAVSAQVDYLLRLADRDEPWWRDFPGWFFQVDLERWPYDNVSASTGVAFAKELRQRTGRWTILYASNGQYDGSLTGWDGPLWNAHYTGRAAGEFAAMYPGDAWKPISGAFTGGWASYSGREPTILQYTSSATIAGLTTCDANAFRGTAAELRAQIEERVNVDELTRLASNGDKWGLDIVTGAQPAKYLGADSQEYTTENKLHTKLDDLATTAAITLAAVRAVALGGIDVPALVSEITTGVIASHDALRDTDRTVISAAVLDALRAGTGPHTL